MAETSFTNSKVIQMSQLFVCVIAHQENAHGDTEMLVGREKVDLCNKYYTVPCSVHQEGGSAVPQFYEGSVQVPATVFCDPFGNELFKKSGNLASTALVKKMAEMLREVKGEKVPLAVWNAAKLLKKKGEAYEERGDYSKALSAYKKIGSLRGSNYFKQLSREALAALNEKGVELLEEALQIESLSKKKSAIRKIVSAFRSLPVSKEASAALKTAK